MSTRKRKAKLFGSEDSLCCCFCGVSLDIDSATIDHIQPVSLGGKNRRSNLAIACRLCNTSRGIIPFEEYYEKTWPLRAAAAGKHVIAGKIRLGFRVGNPLPAEPEPEPEPRKRPGPPKPPNPKLSKKQRARRRREYRKKKAQRRAEERSNQIAPRVPEWWSIRRPDTLPP